jgi:hypothetical protein
METANLTAEYDTYGEGHIIGNDLDELREYVQKADELATDTNECSYFKPVPIEIDVHDGLIEFYPDFETYNHASSDYYVYRGKATDSAYTKSSERFNFSMRYSVKDDVITITSTDIIAI